MMDTSSTLTSSCRNAGMKSSESLSFVSAVRGASSSDVPGSGTSGGVAGSGICPPRDHQYRPRSDRELIASVASQLAPDAVVEDQERQPEGPEGALRPLPPRCRRRHQDARRTPASSTRQY